MSILCTLLSCSAVILNSIELTSQSKGILADGPNSGSHRRGTSSSSASRNFTDMTHSLTTPDYSASSSSPVRERSRSPTLKNTFPSVFGFSFEDLASIRLIPHDHPNRVFKLRIFVFPPDKQIGLKSKFRDLRTIPPKEQIVLSTSNGDVYAILEKKPNRHTNVREIFTSVSGRLVRVKINMDSGAIEKLNVDEIMECPPTADGKIVKSYGVLQFKNTTGSSADPHYPATSPTPAEPRLRGPVDSPTLRRTFPRVLGYSFGELSSIRLAPLTNPNQIFELRRYIFSPDKPLRLRTGSRVLIPMPTGQQIVLSTPNGDICAISEKGSKKQTLIRAMFTPIFGMAERAKININSGVVEEMKAGEIAKCPLSSKAPIRDTYRVFRV